MKGSVFLFTVSFCLSSMSAFAVDREELLFRDIGHRVFVSEFERSMTVVALQSKVVGACTDDPTVTCIPWEFVSSNAADETRYLSTVQSAVNLWNSNTSSKIRFVYRGFSTTHLSTPYQFQRDSDGGMTKTPAVDEFGNNIIAGNFIISMAGAPLDPNGNPEFEFPHGIVSKNMKYSIPSADHSIAETHWGGIYLNPQFSPGEDCTYDEGHQTGSYNLRSVIAHEMGRLLGLAPTSNSTSALFPLCPLIARLSADDVRSVSQIYPANGFLESLGKLSGRAINGQDGSPIVGAQIHIVPASHLTDLSRQWIVSTTLSRHDGRFQFEAIPADNYIVIVEPLSNSGLLPTDLDDWMAVFASSQDFETEFYDGKDRESNHEAALGFSPQSAVYAATIPIVENETNADLEFVSNVGDPNIATISAKGATHEVLSNYTPPHPNTDLNQSNNDAAALEAAPTVGGCEISQSYFGSGSILLSLFGILLVLALRQSFVRSVAKREPMRTPITREERLRRLQKFRVRFHRFTNRS